MRISFYWSGEVGIMFYSDTETDGLSVGV